MDILPRWYPSSRYSFERQGHCVHNRDATTITRQGRFTVGPNVRVSD